MLKAFWVMVNVKTGQLTLGGQFDAYKRGQLERNIHTETDSPLKSVGNFFLHLLKPLIILM